MAFMCDGCRHSESKYSATTKAKYAVQNSTWGPLRDLGMRIATAHKTEDIYNMSLLDFMSLADPHEIFELQENFNNNGNFGQLYLARDKRDGKTVCVKMLSMDATDEMILQEVRGHALASKHPSVCALYGVFMEEGWLTWWPEVSRRVWLVMEYAKGPTLQQHIGGGIQDEKEIVRILRQIVDCVAFLHSRKIIHRDLKSANFVLDGEKNIRLVDFGSSAMIPEVGQSFTTDEIVGSLPYFAPEVYGGTYGPATDMFALGALSIELGSGVVPFFFVEVRMSEYISKGLEVLVAAKRIQEEVSQYQITFGKHFSSEYQSFAKKLLAMDPSQRLQAAAAAKESFLA